MDINQLKENFRQCTQLQYNGKLQIQEEKGHKWTFFYRLGRIVWASGGIHPYRRFRRYIKQHCPNIDLRKIQLSSQDIAVDYWDYNILEILYAQEKITRESINVITQNCIEELLFDIVQQTHSNSLFCDRNQDIILQNPMSFTSTDISLQQMEELWKQWSEAGLAHFSPNQAPVLRRPEQLQQQVSNVTYNNFVKLMDGNYTLRDLALFVKQNPTLVTRSLLPYILKGIIDLVEINDKPILFQNIDKESNAVKSVSKNPVVFCIDDSPQICKMLEQILTKNGIKTITVQDPIQALPKLIEHKPDLIFLDLVMPVVSGYEICSKLRKISKIADTPVVILTGSHGLVDRVREQIIAKINSIGANEFMSKPLDEDILIAITRKYLENPNSSPDFRDYL